MDKYKSRVINKKHFEFSIFFILCIQNIKLRIPLFEILNRNILKIVINKQIIEYVMNLECKMVTIDVHTANNYFESINSENLSSIWQHEWYIFCYYLRVAIYEIWSCSTSAWIHLTKCINGIAIVELQKCIIDIEWSYIALDD